MAGRVAATRKDALWINIVVILSLLLVPLVPLTGNPFLPQSSEAATLAPSDDAPGGAAVLLPPPGVAGRGLQPEAPGAGTVQIGVSPATSNVTYGQVFSVTVVITAGSTGVDGASAFLNFDPGVVKVSDASGVVTNTSNVTNTMIGGTALTDELVNSVDNLVGQINYSAGKLTGALPSGNFRLVTIYFKVVGYSSGMPLAFNSAVPRATDVTGGGNSVLGTMTNGQVINPRPSWWNTAYGYRQPVVVTNCSTGSLPAGYSVQVALSGSTANQVYTNSLVNGNDVRLMYWTGTTWTELDRDLATFSSSNVTLWFKTQAAIPASSTNAAYFLYYGNPAAGAPPASKSNVYALWEDFSSYTVGSPPPGSVWTTPASSGTWTVANTPGVLDGNYLRQDGRTAPSRIYQLGGMAYTTNQISTATGTDMVVEAKLRVFSPSVNLAPSIAVRYDPGTQNWMVVEYYAGHLYLWPIVGGVGQAWAQDVTIPGGLDVVGADHTYRYAGVGNNHRVWIDNTLYADANYAMTAGSRLGLGSFGDQVGFDNIKVRALVSCEPTSTLGTVETLQSTDMAVTANGVATVPPGATIPFTVTYSNVSANDAFNVVVTDTLASGVTLVGATSGYVQTGNQLVWSPGTVAAGASTTLIITTSVPLTATGGTTYVNTARVSSRNTDTNTGNNIASFTSTVVTSPDLWLTKSMTGTAARGNTITYTVSYGNNNGQAATNPTITDTLPAGLNFVGATPGYTQTGSQLVWSGLTLPGSITVTAQVQAAASCGQVITNTAVIGSSSGEANAADNTASVANTVACPDLQITKTAQSTGVPGTLITYTINYTNSGSVPATGVGITDTLPTGTSLVSYTSAGSVVTTSGSVVWSGLADISASASGSLQVVAQISPGAGCTGSLTNTVTIAGDNGDTIPGNNTGTVSTTLKCADLSTAMTAVGAVTGGGSSQWRVGYSNGGTAAAASPVLTATLPGGITFSDSAGGSVVTDVNSSNVVWSGFGPVAAGASGAFTITAGYPITLTCGASLAVGSSIYSPDPESNAGNNTYSGTATAQCPNLNVTKTMYGAAPAAPGSPVTYTIVVSNDNVVPAYQVGITDTLPAELGSPTTTTVASIGMGSAYTYVVSAVVPIGVAPGTVLTNVGTALAANGDSSSANNTSTITATVGTPITLTSPSCVTTSSFTPGIPQNITWSTTGVNWSNPSNTVAISYTLDGISYSVITTTAPNTGSYSWTPPEANTSTAQVRIVLTDGSAQTWTATSCQFRLAHIADLSISKGLYNSNGSIHNGNFVQFAITVTNAGPEAATSVLVTDVLPANLSFLDFYPLGGTSVLSNTSTAGGTLTFSATSLAAGYSETIIVRTQVTGIVADTTLTNTAAISSGVFDPSAGNNTATAAISVSPATRDIRTSLSCDREVPRESDIGCTIVVSNTGNSTAENVVVDAYPGASYVAFRWTDRPALMTNLDNSTNDATWGLGPLMPNDSVSLKVVFRLGVTVTASSVPITATATTSSTETSTGNNSAAVNVVVNEEPSTARAYGPRFTNTSDSGTTASWLTNPQRFEAVQYWPASGSDSAALTALDVDGGGRAHKLHYADVGYLAPSTEYNFRIVSPRVVQAGSVFSQTYDLADNNDGRMYRVTTGPVLSAWPAPGAAYGSVAETGLPGSCPEYRTVVYATIVDTNGLGSSGQSGALSALAGSNCQWSLTPGNARTRDLSGYFVYSPSVDYLYAFAQSEKGNGTGSGTVASAAPMSTINMTWGTTGSISLVAGWNLVTLPVDPLDPNGPSSSTIKADWLAGKANDVGGPGTVTQVLQLKDGGWDPYIAGQADSNFDLSSFQSYAVYASQAVTLTYNNAWRFRSAAKETVNGGWSPLADPYQTEVRKASQVLTEARAGSRTSADLYVYRWTGDSWEVMMLTGGGAGTLSGTDFTVRSQDGLLMKAPALSPWPWQSAAGWH